LLPEDGAKESQLGEQGRLLPEDDLIATLPNLPAAEDEVASKCSGQRGCGVAGAPPIERSSLSKSTVEICLIR
jgi:hypothetical protein